MRPLHHGSDRDAKWLATVLALIEARASALALHFGDPVAHYAAMRANWAIRPKQGFKVLARLVVIVENRVAKIEFFACHFGRLSTYEAILNHVAWYVNRIVPLRGCKCSGWRARAF